MLLRALNSTSLCAWIAKLWKVGKNSTFLNTVCGPVQQPRLVSGCRWRYLGSEYLSRGLKEMHGNITIISTQHSAPVLLIVLAEPEAWRIQCGSGIHLRVPHLFARIELNVFCCTRTVASRMCDTRNLLNGTLHYVTVTPASLKWA